jgi:hypothetical protein
LAETLVPSRGSGGDIGVALAFLAAIKRRIEVV